MVGSQEVRLFGIDAPEAKQSCSRNDQAWSCGLASAEQLSKVVSGRPVRCVAVGSDKYHRAVARCSVGELDVNRYMVAAGYALAYRRYSLDYVSAEESARASRRGMWSSKFELPETYRHHDGDVIDRVREDHAGSKVQIVRGSRSKPQPAGNCRIKGNQSRRGERIYHLPGMPYYEATVAEQIFCTERDARAAGYRRSRADQYR